MLIAVVWINYHLASVTVNLLQLRGLARPLLTQCPSTPSPLLTAAARQQWRRGAKMINNDWQATGGRVIGHMRNHENRHQQYHENWSAYVAMIGALKQHRQKCMHLAWHFLQESAWHFQLRTTIETRLHVRLTSDQSEPQCLHLSVRSVELMPSYAGLINIIIVYYARSSTE